ncbi:NAD-glutamate dehydrogenase [Ferrimonas balearica]|uniref:NAD-glutamate dehydrogenase n=1 Tax=Ferrimonas balearica TaxID=44012 RepID=UPI001C98F4A0|nr:NAD-glutamate dehydrogenase [Ferrimonas balearica]MBY5991585.1 NAD-glutamate dehydrogenase [Ferrimonas balearica]
MAKQLSTPLVLLENVVELIHKKLPEQDAHLVESFARIIFGTLAKDELSQRSDSDLYGATLSLWNTLNQAASGEFKNRVYNPVQSTHGWQSAHSVIEMVQPDMPFLVDSVSMALNRFGVSSHLMIHSPIAVARDEQGRITAVRHVLDGEPDDERVAVFLVEVENLAEDERMQALGDELKSVIQDVTASVTDWQPMQAKLAEVIDGLKAGPAVGHESERDEAVAFLEFLSNHHFTFLGYRHYDLKKVEGDMSLAGDNSTSLGIMKDQPSQGLLLSSLPEQARKEALGQSRLILTKTNTKSRVHRPAYIDYVGVKRFDEQGNVIGEDRFIGLYASSMYNRSPREIPLINRKLERVIARSGLAPRSHDYKALMNILETYPRDELIQANEKQLYEGALGILHMQDRDKVRLFVRRDPFGRFFSALVFTTKERYNTQLRIKTQKLLAECFQSEDEVEFTTYFSESTLARTHYLVKVEDNNMDIDVNELENNLVELARSWEDKLDAALVESRGEAQGKMLSRRFINAFPRSYKEDVLPSAALVDIENLEKLETADELGMLFYQPQEKALGGKQVCLKLFHKHEPIHLSDVLPMLENFGLRVIGERPYQVVTAEGKEYWILDFSMTFKGEVKEEISAYQNRFQDALGKVWAGDYEDDGFNHLVLSAGLTGREVTLLRAYAKYMRQIGVTFSQEYIAETLDHYPHIARLLVEMFNRRFNPSSRANRELEKQLTQVEAYLDDVANLDDDRIIRRYVELIEATLRTNFYQAAESGDDKSYVSFKVLPERIPEMPLPLPKFEIFVYSPRMEGVHLRGGKVARGGLRWSDRREDFRTEVLGLVKAQQVKNTVIVPSGAKGGFVCKQLPSEREAMQAEGQACYRMFIRGLLDVTDNIEQGELVPPTSVVRHDEDDPYLVVAADKGTATFSDIANSISEEYDFWLGDAFASGGQYGYDHKKMGITARGGWESVKRHFREIGVDCQSTDFTCLAVGDMAGDVFGNGMLLSRHTRLVAAFNHLHIFIDPNPDAAKSYVERERLFALPRSSWEDYDASLISEGGGVFNRSAKAIKLSAQMKAMLGSKKTQMTPNELIQHLLQMEVDLLWNGGIGTYVKGSQETHIEVGDRANDAVRINGSQLKAKIVGEGGNLGLTQLGRIEYAHAGGRINTDFVDNVGGVDCSDNEVNIKILLNRLVVEGELTVKQRNKLLMDMTDEVAEIVLEDCRNQTLSISITEARNGEQLKEQIRFIHYLEKEGKLDRALEFLPTDEELSERLAAGHGLTRPELSVLVAYAKMVLKEQLVDPQVTDEPTVAQRLIGYFPVRLQERYSDWMKEHPLRAEIIATSLANDIINNMGLNFIQRMQDETGASVSEVALSYTIAAQVFGFDSIKAQIIELNAVVDAEQQHEMLYQLQRTVRRATRWFLRRRTGNLEVQASVEFFAPVVEELSGNFDSLLQEEEAEGLKSRAQALVDGGVTAELANTVSRLSTLFSALDVAEIAQQDDKPVPLVAETYFRLGAGIELHWFLEQINEQPVSNHWQALARAGFREELDWLQRRLTLVVLRNCGAQCEADAIIEQWVNDNNATLDRWLHMMAEFRTSKSHEFSKFSVALRELNLLIMRCDSATESR